METINALHVSFLFDCSKQVALYEVYKCNDKLDEFEQLRKERTKDGELKFVKSDYTNAEIQIEKISAYKNVDITQLLDSINKDFTKSWECCQYLLKRLLAKYKPNNKTGAYPVSLSLPSEISSLMTDESRLKCITWAEKNFTGYRRKPDGSLIPIIFKA